MKHKLHQMPRLNSVLCIWISISLFSVFSLTESMCGLPSLSLNCKYNEDKITEYKTGDTVNYFCSKQLCYAPIYMRRECLANGSWSGSIPFCYVPSGVQDVENVYKVRKQLFGLERFEKLFTNKPIDFKKCLFGSAKNNSYFEIILKKSSRVVLVKFFVKDLTVSAAVRVLDENGPVHYCDKHTREREWEIEESRDEEIEENCGDDMDRVEEIFKCSDDVIGNRIQIIPIKTHNSLEAEPFVICQVQMFLQPDYACDRPDLPHKSRGSTNILGTTYLLHCDEDYKPMGENLVSCRKNGTWTESSFKCINKSDCGELPELDNGKILYNSSTANSIAWVVCNKGFLPSRRSIRCISGNWNAYSMRCERIQCDPNPEIAHGKVILPDGSHYGSKFHVICDNGYTAEEHEFLECDENGIWRNLKFCKLSVVLMSAGITISVLFLAMCVLLIVCLAKKKRKQQSTNSSIQHSSRSESGLYDEPLDLPHENYYSTENVKINDGRKNIYSTQPKRRSHAYYENVMELSNNSPSINTRGACDAPPSLSTFY